LIRRQQDVTGALQLQRYPHFQVYRFQELLQTPPYALVESGRDLWVGTGQGLLRFQPDIGSWTLFGESAGIPAPVVRAVAPVPDGLLVSLANFSSVGDFLDHGTWRFDPRSLEWKRISERSAQDMQWDGERAWLASGRLETWEPRWPAAVPVPERQVRFPSESVCAVQVWKDMVWFGLGGDLAPQQQRRRTGGIAVFSRRDSSWTQYYEGDRLAVNRVSDVAVDEREAWACHWGERDGLSRYDRATGRWSAAYQGPHREWIGGTHLELDGEYLWIGQPHALVRLHRQTGETVVYREQDGLPGYRVTALYRGRDSLWAAVHGPAMNNGIRMGGIVRFLRLAEDPTSRY